MFTECVVEWYVVLVYVNFKIKDISLKSYTTMLQAEESETCEMCVMFPWNALVLVEETSIYKISTCIYGNMLLTTS